MGITMGEGKRRDYKDFSLRMSSSLSKLVGVLYKPFLGFFSLNRLFIISVGNEGIYSMSDGNTKSHNFQ